MADWKQITARIHRARTGKDPATQLSNLYQKTRDAMVAFELARFLESAGQTADAAKWYSTAAERFRRADWKTKAREAATRLGGQSSDQPLPSPAEGVPVLSIPEPASPFEQTATAFETIANPSEETAPAASPVPRERTGRTRGRRGGRNRRRRSSTVKNAPTAAGQAPPLSIREPSPQVDVSPEPRFASVSESISAPRLPAEPTAESAAPGLRGRYGDPGLSSRMTLLEMQFRRLLSCPPLKLDAAERAPAGPGVLLLSDSDLTTHYHVEACRTLRIAVANILRGGASRRGEESFKPQLAEHLGIAESRVSKYLAEHCVVRYLQLDEGASHFAHFVVAVLRPTLND